MKILVIGGVAAGTKVAAKIKRLDREAEVTLITKESGISYATCALPYFVGGMIDDEGDLSANTPEKFESLTGVRVLTDVEAEAVNPHVKTVSAKDRSNDAMYELPYDKLVIATGTSPVVPDIFKRKIEGVFGLSRPDDAVKMRKYIEDNGVKTAVVVGGGHVGLEIADSLKARGINVYVVEKGTTILGSSFDFEMADYVIRHLEKQGIHVMTSTSVDELVGTDKICAVNTSKGYINCSLVVVAAGTRPNTDFLDGSGVELYNGRIVVGEDMSTSVEDIYAAGDCVVINNRISGRKTPSNQASMAALEARALAGVLAGREGSFRGTLGTGIIKLTALNCARTGLTESEALDCGFDVVTTLAIADDKPSYYPEASFFATKLIAERSSGRLLGVQSLGSGSVDKMIDIAVTAISCGATVYDFVDMDLAYAPPFATAVHPFVQSVLLLINKMNGDMISMTPAEYMQGKADGYRIIDTSRTPAITGATYVDFTKINGEIEGIAKDEKLLIVCNRGRRAYLTQNRMRHYGYANTVVLEGSTLFNVVKATAVKSSLTDEDIARVKGLGFLRDKNTPDCFNCRVITRNGKITADESIAIAEASKRFGSGEVAMTTRQTVEIQGIPYDKIDDLISFLAMAGLEPGGTGSKVRPIVACKGTTCQYGLIDAYSISEEIHERFYKGYREVKLPHKFKIAVGGCPNNCVKPNLNDLGVVGQKAPVLNPDKCRGCKVCSVEKSCPMKAVNVSDGKVVINDSICNNCGRCVTKCPFGAFEGYVSGYRIYVGGRWGKKVAHGVPLRKLFTDREEVMQTIEKAILFFREQGITGERFADTIERIGFENAEKMILSDELLARKEQNLSEAKHTKGGATC